MRTKKTLAVLGIIGLLTIAFMVMGTTAYIPTAETDGPWHITGKWTYYGGKYHSSPGWDTLPDTASGTAVTVMTGKFTPETDTIFVEGIIDGDSTHASNADSADICVWLFQTFDMGTTYIQVDSVILKGLTLGNGLYVEGALTCASGCEAYFKYKSILTTLDTTRHNLQAWGFKGHLRP